MKKFIRSRSAGIGSLVLGAIVWGVIWFPYRLLKDAGFSGVLSSALTYTVALLVGTLMLPGAWRGFRPSWGLLAIGLAAGACNLGYVLATLHGTVMRVLLLFYLAPLWTVLLSRLLLRERLTGAGAAVVALSVAGAFVMLWQPELGLPLPLVPAEWVGLASGLLFALSNVLIRREANLNIQIKSLAVFAGAVVIGLALLPLDPSPGPLRFEPAVSVMIVGIGLVLLAINLVVQHGLMLIPANQAIVILLFELVVAALASWLLAGEAMSPKEWLGGAMIIAASMLSGRLEGGQQAPPQAESAGS